MKKKEDRVFVNTPMAPELVKKLDEMAETYESTRAQFIRLLVKKQYTEFKDQKEKVAEPAR